MVLVLSRLNQGRFERRMNATYVANRLKNCYRDETKSASYRRDWLKVFRVILRGRKENYKLPRDKLHSCLIRRIASGSPQKHFDRARNDGMLISRDFNGFFSCYCARIIDYRGRGAKLVRQISSDISSYSSEAKLSKRRKTRRAILTRSYVMH